MTRVAILLLRVRLAFARLGWIETASLFLLLCAAVIWLLAVPGGQERIAARQAALDEMQRARRLLSQSPEQQAVPKTTSETNLENFRSRLGDAHAVEQQVRILFAAGKEAGLTLDRAEYRFSDDRNGGFHAYRIQLPVKGSYAAIRKFSTQVLEKIPFAALDGIEFKRDSIASAGLDAQLHLTLFLDDKPASGTQETPHSAENGKAP